LYLYSRDSVLTEHAAGLFDPVGSEDVDGLVAKAGFVDLGVITRRQDQIQARLQSEYEASDDPYIQEIMGELLADLQEWDRISTTLRFSSG